MLQGRPYRSGNQDGAASGAELVQRLLAVALGPVAVDTGAGVALAVQEVLQGVGALLGLNEHQCERVLPWGRGGERGDNDCTAFIYYI